VGRLSRRLKLIRQIINDDWHTVARLDIRLENVEHFAQSFVVGSDLFHERPLYSHGMTCSAFESSIRKWRTVSAQN